MNDKFIKEVLGLFLTWVINNPKIINNLNINDSVETFLNETKLKIKE